MEHGLEEKRRLLVNRGLEDSCNMMAPDSAQNHGIA